MRTFDLPTDRPIDSLDILKQGIDTLVAQAADPIHTYVGKHSDGSECASQVVNTMTVAGLRRDVGGKASHVRTMLGSYQDRNTSEFLSAVIGAYEELPGIFRECRDPNMPILADAQGQMKEDYITAVGQIQEGIGHFVDSCRRNAVA